jgi:hypothetical protein
MALPQSAALQSTLTPRPLVGGDLPPPVGPIFERLAEALVHPAVVLSNRSAA